MALLKRLVIDHIGLLLALLVYLFLALAYFFIVPIFEGPDEWTHTGHVKYIAKGNGLPVMLPGQGIWGGQQPPLYYAVGALLVQPFDLNGVEDYEENRRNPHAAIGYALDPGNKNNYLHPPAASFPWRGLPLTVHVLRLYSMSFGIITIVFTYLIALELFNYQIANSKSQPPIHKHTPDKAKGLPTSHPQSPPLFATLIALLVACQPMFAFITASVANEPANIAFCTVGLWLAQRYVIRGPSRHWGRAVALGVTLGLISLSKMTGLSFGLVAVVAILITIIATRKQSSAGRLLWRDGIIIGLLFLSVGGWWYWRNYRLYGDFFQQGLYKIYFNVDPQSLTLRDFLFILFNSEVSFWATFGWLNIAAPEWAYTVYRVISRIGLLGVFMVPAVGIWKRIWDRTPPLADVARFFSPLLLHLVFPVALAFSLTRLVATEGGMQGRQLLPAIGSIATLMGWGWWMLSPKRIRLVVLALLVAVIFGLAVWLPFGLVAPAYIPKPLLTEADLPPDLDRLDLTYDGEMKLIGVKIATEKIRPGERLPITVYWQALKPMDTNYSVFVHLVGRDQTIVGQFNTYPALGLRPTSTLEPGQIVADTYPVLVAGDSQAPTRLRVNVGLFNFDEPGRPGIQPIALDGQPASSTVAHLKLVPAKWPTDKGRPPVAEFADQIRLLDYSLENCRSGATDCRLILTWLAQGQPATDYTVFVQLWRNDQLVKGFDTPPLNNNYPTGLWAADEVIIDPHALDLSGLAPGDYRVLVGLYNFATGERLAVTANGVAWPDYAVDLGTIEIQ